MRTSGFAALLAAAAMAIAGCVESKREQESTQPPSAITEESAGISSDKTNEPPLEKLKYNDIEKTEFSCLLEAESAEGVGSRSGPTGRAIRGADMLT